jgi:hypothetical protein
MHYWGKISILIHLYLGRQDIYMLNIIFLFHLEFLDCSSPEISAYFLPKWALFIIYIQVIFQIPSAQILILSILTTKSLITVKLFNTRWFIHISKLLFKEFFFKIWCEIWSHCVTQVGFDSWFPWLPSGWIIDIYWHTQADMLCRARKFMDILCKQILFLKILHI